MYYEEKYDNGVWYCRTHPIGQWSVKRVQCAKGDETTAEAKCIQLKVVNALLLDALKASHIFVKLQCDMYDAGDTTRGDFELLEFIETAIAKGEKTL